MAEDPSSVFSITSQSCQRWTLLLADTLTDQINEYLHHLYELSIKTTLESGKSDINSIYGVFQRRCLSVSDIPYDELNKRIELLESKLPNLQNVIKTVLKLNFAVMAVARTNNLTSIKIPAVDKRDFMKKCYQTCALEVGCKNPQWFDKTIAGQKRMVYHGYAKTAINKMILKVVLDHLPLSDITASNKMIRQRSRSPKRSPNRYEVELETQSSPSKKYEKPAKEFFETKKVSIKDERKQVEKQVQKETEKQIDKKADSLVQKQQSIKKTESDKDENKKKEFVKEDKKEEKKKEERQSEKKTDSKRQFPRMQTRSSSRSMQQETREPATDTKRKPETVKKASKNDHIKSPTESLNENTMKTPANTPTQSKGTPKISVPIRTESVMINNAAPGEIVLVEKTLAEAKDEERQHDKQKEQEKEQTQLQKQKQEPTNQEKQTKSSSETQQITPADSRSSNLEDTIKQSEIAADKLAESESEHEAEFDEEFENDEEIVDEEEQSEEEHSEDE